LLAATSAAAVVGTDGSADAVAAAAEHAVDDVSVIEDLYGSEEYKTHLAKVFVRRALMSAVERAGG
ncbi:MAG: xanthine dehydrogenase family protein subunit M, partial [Actinobacteria bacterium]|nr:xanthine dehydrogenase family protein subunit M [Actinomycetota bacterium]NIU71920.1 xanthine dehydrogenase family protein subunit M [Actinomycetota bacterium]NIV91155.1 xanthine dehydrogenase family protein subunit M [Actinomycetota bacterium]NIW33862.1 xanthine dehydrogenase family protein subunit M [Actinomycetota bacterium]